MANRHSELPLNRHSRLTVTLGTKQLKVVHLINGFIAETLRGIKKLAWLWSLVFGGGEIRYDYD